MRRDAFPQRPDAPVIALRDLATPAALAPAGAAVGGGGLASLDLLIDADKGALLPWSAEAAAAAVEVSAGGAMVFPAFADMHTHLDKGHIWPRAANPTGTFRDALATVSADRAANWRAEDVRRRMDFALRCAFAHGSGAIRTHLDSRAPQHEISWPVFRDMRAEWAGRIELQAVNLVPIDDVDDTPFFHALADLVAESGGVLGAVGFPVPDLARRLDAFFRVAAARGLSADFHVDETADPASEVLRAVAEAKMRAGFDGAVVCGHCCSLATQDEARALDTIEAVAAAGIDVVSLPLCNLYLQDRADPDRSDPAAGAARPRTPRWRGVTLVHELQAAGVRVAFASDNTRDPFYAYGDLDMVEVMREATRIAHLDHSDPGWPRAFTETPRRICGFADPAPFAPGAPADLVILRAREWTELFARPQSDRLVLRAGRPIDAAPPDYAELDDLMETER
ncbi:MAG: cytosine deaminase [Pseudomonadota bacterium]